jgi:putative hydrolase of the HAD superfamily
MSASPVLVLDLDGVVLKPTEPWEAALPPDLGVPPAEIATDFFDRSFRAVLQGRLDLYVALHEWLDARGLADRLEYFVTYWFERDGRIDEAVLAAAAGWRERTGGKVFAASNQEHHRAAWLRDRLGLGEHFDEIVYSAALGVCKPDRVFFTNAQARMGVTVAQSILFVDDKAENVDAARMCGWRAMLYRGSESLAGALAQWG